MTTRKPKRQPAPASMARWHKRFEFAAVYADRLKKTLERGKVADVPAAIEGLRSAVDRYTATLPLQQQLGTPGQVRDHLARVAEHANALAAELQAMDARARAALAAEWISRHGQRIDFDDAGMHLYDLAAVAQVAAGKIDVRPGRTAKGHSHAELISMIEAALVPHGIALSEGGVFLAVASEIFAAAELSSSSPKDGIAALRRLREEMGESG